MRHDHVEDQVKGSERVREAAYRRGCHQAIALAVRELEKRGVPTDRWDVYLDVLVKTLGEMRFNQAEYSLYLHKAMQEAWGDPE